MRKYGKSRNSKRNLEDDTADANAQFHTTSRTRKRQRIAIEVVDEGSSSTARTKPSSSNNIRDPFDAGFDDQKSSHSLQSLREQSTDGDRSSFLPDFTVSMVHLPSTRQISPVCERSTPRSSDTQKILPTREETDSRTSTPRKPAKNLSQLFDMSPSPGSLAKNDGVRRRMLTRSRTESSISSESPGGSHSFSSSLKQLERSPRRVIPVPISRQSTPSKENLLEVDYAPPSSPSTPTQHAPVVPHVRTYGGRSRSFLVTLPVSQLGDSSHPEELHQGAEEEFDSRESYTDLRTRWGVDNSEDDPQTVFSANSSPGKRKGLKASIPPPADPLPNGMMNDLKSITELRSKGESRRFLDEVGYLFEGLDPKGGIGLRRASALEIVSKLCDADFARKAKAADFLGRSWVVLRGAGAGAGDKILDVILVFFAALVARDTNSLTELSHKTDLVDTIFSMLSTASHENDWLGPLSMGVSDSKLKKSGSLNKSEKALSTSLCDIIASKGGFFSPSVTISTRLLASRTLVRLDPKLINPQHLSALYFSLKRELSLFPPRVTAYMAGLSLFPPLSVSSHADRPSFEHLENCLRLMDSYLSGQWSDPGLQSDQLESDGEAFVDGLVALCIAANVIAEGLECGYNQETAYRCLDVTLRVLVNLTHENQGWCETLVHHDLTLPLIMRSLNQPRHHTTNISENELTAQTGDHGDSQASGSDRVYLALALLTNIMQVNDKAVGLCREMRISLKCPAKRDCLKGCRCMHRVGGLEYLAFIYAQRDEAAGLIDPFLRGHLAVLFGLLMQRHNRYQEALLSVLPGESNYIKLNSLVMQAREFVTFYAELTTQLVNFGTGQEASKVAFRQTDHGIGRIIAEGRGGDVVRDVVSFLEQLRDHP